MNETTPNQGLPTPAWRYATPAMLLHWLLAVLVAILVTVGWYMLSIEEEPRSAWYFDKHKSFGMIAFVLVLLRIWWRARHRPAPLPDYVPRWQVTLAHLTEWSLYGCLFLMPILGFLGASYSEEGVTFFGAALPAWAAQDHDRSEQLFSLHIGLAWVMVALIALHVAGALKHLLIDRDGVFQRMWPR